MKPSYNRLRRLEGLAYQYSSRRYDQDLHELLQRLKDTLSPTERQVVEDALSGFMGNPAAIPEEIQQKIRADAEAGRLLVILSFVSKERAHSVFTAISSAPPVRFFELDE